MVAPIAWTKSEKPFGRFFGTHVRGHWNMHGLMPTNNAGRPSARGSHPEAMIQSFLLLTPPNLSKKPWKPSHRPVPRDTSVG